MTRAEIPETGQNIKGALIRSHLQHFSADWYWCVMLSLPEERDESVLPSMWTADLDRYMQVSSSMDQREMLDDLFHLFPCQLQRKCITWLFKKRWCMTWNPGSRPKEELDLQSGNAEVLLSCARSERRERIHRICEYEEIKASCAPAASEPRLKAVSTSKCERAFSTMAVKLKEVLKKGCGEVQSVMCCSQDYSPTNTGSLIYIFGYKDNWEVKNCGYPCFSWYSYV